jgi:RNA polymerase sigma factor (sigma-70 family)
MPPTSEAALEGASAGQAVTLAAFFQQHKRRAYQFALQMVGDPDDAMELTQEAFLRLHRHWKGRDPGRPAKAWMYAVLRNLAIDLLRKRAVRQQAEGAAPEEAAGGPGPEALAARRELSAAIRQAIERLPVAQREVLLLKDFHGLSYAEIARVTGATPALVASRLHDARQRLRRRLARYL